MGQVLVGLRGVAAGAMCRGTIAVGRRIGGIELDGLTVVGNGLFGIAAIRPRATAGEIGTAVPRAEPDRLGEGGNGLIRLIVVEVFQAPVIGLSGILGFNELG